MKYLDTYEKLNIKKDENEVFEHLIETFTDSIFTWNHFVDFEKVKIKLKKIEPELNLLNVLIGKEDIEKCFIDLVKGYPKIRKALPILLAVRDIKKFNIIDDLEELTSNNKQDLFDPSVKLTSEIETDIIVFFKDSGLSDIFKNKNIKNIVDYCFGIEVGMDTNARKNRTGEAMESTIERIIKKFSETNNLEYIPKATKSKIKQKWGYDINLDKTNRIFDFAVYNKSKNKIFIIETNYYGGGGSKLKATAGEYRQLFDFLKNQGIDLLWITDGIGWKETKKPLFETFLHNDYLFNIELIKKGVLEEIIIHQQ